jgi:hypothetical protein
MNPATWLAAILGIATLLAIVRLLWRRRRLPAEARGPRWRLVLQLVGQPALAGLLYLAMLPPPLPGEAGTLVVATAGATDLQLRRSAGDVLVALPEAPPLSGADRVPDLATALRQHPGTARLRVVGAGLVPRDRDAARALPVDFVAADLPRGIVHLASPAQLPPGGALAVHGRANGVPGGRVELRDPAGLRIDARTLPASGEFELAGSARAPGTARFSLRLLDAAGGRVEQLEVPVWVAQTAPARVLVLAGAAGPELKYLRRWIADAGMQPDTRIGAGGGVQLRSGAASLTAADLRQLDVVILDTRAWSGLGAAQRQAVLEAVRGGLGVLLRADTAADAGLSADLRTLGFHLGQAGRETGTASLALPRLDRSEPTASASAVRVSTIAAEPPAQASKPPDFSYRKLGLAGLDAAPLLNSESGEVLAVWRAHGRGRVGLWTPLDSFRLVLAGHPDLHAAMWSGALATLARPGPALAAIDAHAWPGERITLCGLAGPARVTAPDGRATSLVLDPRAGHCAGYWPAQPGWHRLAHAGGAQPFHVHQAAEGLGLKAAGQVLATRQLAMSAGPDLGIQPPAAVPARRGRAWPWLLGFLACAAALWWLERARPRVADPAAP